MAMVFVRSALALAGLCVAVGTALADMPPMATAAGSPTEPPAKGAAPDPDHLVIARQIVSIVFPEQRADALVGSILKAMGPNIDLQIRGRFPSDDPGLEAIRSNYLAKSQHSVRAALISQTGNLTDAMAISYSRQFNMQELAQILAFAKTPTGAKYLGFTPTMFQDPAVNSVYTGLIPAATDSELKLESEFTDKVRDYLILNPELAKKLMAASTH